MPRCIVCGTELEPPPGRPTPSTSRACTESPARTYCRHHIIRAAVAGGVITAIKPSAGLVVAIPRE